MTKAFDVEHALAAELTTRREGRDAWNESKHPRASGGQFGSGGSGEHPEYTAAKHAAGEKQKEEAAKAKKQAALHTAAAKRKQTEAEAHRKGVSSALSEMLKPYDPRAKDLMATDPAVSEKQRRAMCAAAHGGSTLGIPKDVDEEYCK